MNNDRVMASEHYVVVEDEAGEYWEGSVVDHARAGKLAARGAVVLPCDPTLFTSGVGGYARRAWGAGWPLDYATPRTCCPVTIYVRKPGHPDARVQDRPTLTWRARLVAAPAVEERMRAGERFEGMIRFVADGGQPFPAFATYASDEKPILLAQIDKPGEDGEWIIGGSGQVNVPQDGHYGFGLYGCAPGFRVAWVAASLSRLG